jgi:hypothetical protein
MISSALPKAIKDALASGLLLATTALVLQLGYLANRAEESLAQADAQLYYQNIALIRLEERLGRAAERSARELALAREDLKQTAGEALLEIHGHMEQANDALYRTGYALAQSAGSMAVDFERLAGGAAQIESQLSEAVSLSFDCLNQSRDSDGAVIFEGNADCFHNRFVGAARGIEQAAKAWGDAAPRQAQAATGLLEHGAQAAEHTEAITKDLAKQPPLWFRALKWLRRLRPW